MGQGEGRGEGKRVVEGKSVDLEGRRIMHRSADGDTGSVSGDTLCTRCV